MCSVHENGYFYGWDAHIGLYVWSINMSCDSISVFCGTALLILGGLNWFCHSCVTFCSKSITALIWMVFIVIAIWQTNNTRHATHTWRYMESGRSGEMADYNSSTCKQIVWARPTCWFRSAGWLRIYMRGLRPSGCDGTGMRSVELSWTSACGICPTLP